GADVRCARCDRAAPAIARPTAREALHEPRLRRARRASEVLVRGGPNHPARGVPARLVGALRGLQRLLRTLWITCGLVNSPGSPGRPALARSSEAPGYHITSRPREAIAPFGTSSPARSGAPVATRKPLPDVLLINTLRRNAWARGICAWSDA